MVLQLAEVLAAVGMTRLVPATGHVGGCGERRHAKRQRPDQGGGEEHPSLDRRFEHALTSWSVV
jgi:hypothetical protein